MKTEETLKYISEKFRLSQKEDVINLPIDRKGMAELFNTLGYKVGAEIGTDRGLYAEQLCKSIPGVKLYCIDPWKTYRRYDDITDQHILNVNYKNTQKRLSPYNCVILKQSSMGAIKDFEPESLDFVYIDGNHNYEYVKEDIEGWFKIVRRGGIVSGHDYVWKQYQRSKRLDVKRALDEYFSRHGVKTLFLTSAKGDSSWFFVK